MGYSTMLMACACAVVAVVAPALGAPPPMDPDMAELAQAVRASCLAESGAAAELIDAANAGAPLAPDAALKCYIKCAMETTGMMSDGVVDVEAILAILPDPLRDRSEPHLRSCGTQPGADHCDIAYNTHVCWQKSSKDDYFLI